MSTYTDLHNRIKENVTILRKPGSKDDGMSPQKVILINPENQFYGTFNGAMNIKGGILSDLNLVGGTIDGAKIKNATFLDGDVEVPLGEIAADVDSHEQRLTQAEADIKAISAAHDALSAWLSSAVDDLSAGIEEKIDAAVEDIDKRISGAVSGLEDLSGDVIGMSSALSDIALNGVVYRGTLSAYHDKYDNPGKLFGDNPACCLLEGHQKPLKNGWMWRVHVDPANVSGYAVVEDKTGQTTTLGEGDYIIIKSHNPNEHEVVPDADMLLDDFDVINAQDGDDAKLSVILKLSSEMMGISAEISGLSSRIAETISSEVIAQADQKYVKKVGDRISALTVDNDLVVGGATLLNDSLSVTAGDSSLVVSDDEVALTADKPIQLRSSGRINAKANGRVTVETQGPIVLSGGGDLSAHLKNQVHFFNEDGLGDIYVNGTSIQSTLDELSNHLNAIKFDRELGELVSSQVNAIQGYVDELSGPPGNEGIVKHLSNEISVLRRDEKFELQLNKVDFWTPEDADGRYSSIGHFLCALLEPTTNDVRNNTGYVVEFGTSVPLSTKILISDGKGTTLGHGDTIYIHELSSVESAPIRIPFAKLQPYDRANKSGNAFILQAGVSRYEFEDQSKNLDDEIANRIAADAYISAWIQQNFANTGEDNVLTTTVLNQEISAKSGLSVDGAVYALNDLSAAKQLFVNNGQLAVANDGERTSVEAVADIVKINNALSASQDTVSIDFSKTVDSSLGVSITDLCVGLSTQLSGEIETRKSDDAFLSNAISTKIWIEDRANDPSDISGYSDLSVVKISKDEYDDLAIGPTRLCANVLYVVESDYVDAYGQEIRNVLSAESETNAATVGQVGAAKSELCAYADEISAQASRELSGKLDLSGGVLTPVYDGNGKKFSDWVCVSATYEGNPITIVETPSEEVDMVNYTPYSNDAAIGRTGTASKDILSLRWWQGVASKIDLIATRTANKILGYQLGEQDDKILAKADTTIQSVIAKTWSELTALRDDSNLVPGQQYRITDYVATTNGDMESRSANHSFDIIVTADDERTLNEHARAIMHDGDLPDDTVDGETRTKYFADCDLAAWDVWYCLDNDTSRFAWADATNGKGVIYRLVDEFSNDVPYDFKGLQFKAYSDTDNVWRYTFDSGGASGNTDKSLNVVLASRNNVINNYCLTESHIFKLNRIVFKGYCHGNTFGSNCYDNTFGSGCIYNTFRGGCYSNTFGMDCSGNTFSGSCTNNTFQNHCVGNVVGKLCRSNYCRYGFSYNQVDYLFDSNTCKENCESNIFGAHFANNTLGIHCQYNTFGGGCSKNTLGDYCQSNTFGAGCYGNTFGASASSLKSYMMNITLESGVRYVNLSPTGTTSDSSYYKNVTVSKGIEGTSNAPKVIEDPNVNQSYKTTYQPSNSKVISI